MAIAKTLKFVKDATGIVLLHKIQDNSLVASFEPSLNIVKERGEPNRFKISSSITADGAGFVLDYRTIDSAVCSPVIVEAGINDFLIELSKKFFFLNKKILAENVEGLSVLLAQTKIYPYGELQVFKIAGNLDNTTQEAGDWCIGFVENQFINAPYLAGDKTLLASYDI